MSINYVGIPVAVVILLGFSPEALATISMLYLLKWLVVVHFMKLEPLTVLDEMFLLDYPENRNNIMTVMKLTKVADAEALRRRLIESGRLFKRNRSILVKRFHEYYFKEVHGEELVKSFDN